MKTRNCPTCKGKGHVLDAAPVIMLVGWGLLFGLLERNDKNGLTRKRCEQCKGKGYIRIPDDFDEDEE